MKVMGRELRLPCDVDEGLHTQEESDADFDIWNQAWSLAVSQSFYLDSPPTVAPRCDL